MKIYIAASWKHQHAVEMLTNELEKRGHTILSWLREGRPEEAFLSKLDLDNFIKSPEGREVFEFCINSVKSADLLIYIGPSGCDAWAEIGMGHGLGKPIFGLLAKSEDVGMMRHMIKEWFSSVVSLLDAVDEFEKR
ncbi:MAG: hypothetical protein IJT38_00630 [Clostridia bacterium]|nr:hypothetical protein [Clostridia bacterium]MBQ7717795.1 hypothetical protein [Clostridia bacterium]